MFAQLPERQMHWTRWVLTIGWLLVIASLFYDPWTAAFTKPDHPWSPLRLSDACVQVQGQCLAEQPYPLGATLFWGAIVPSGILILLIFGHEVWRRICPLSFLSQIPRALGWQRQFKRENATTGKVRYELAKVKSDSWLGPQLSLSAVWLAVYGTLRTNFVFQCRSPHPGAVDFICDCDGHCRGLFLWRQVLVPIFLPDGTRPRNF